MGAAAPRPRASHEDGGTGAAGPPPELGESQGGRAEGTQRARGRCSPEGNRRAGDGVWQGETRAAWEGGDTRRCGGTPQTQRPAGLVDEGEKRLGGGWEGQAGFLP